MVGQTISHYRVLEKLGEGGMGEVFKAEDTKLGRPVALKFLAPHLLSNEDAKQRFAREARAAAALNHPNICTVYEIDEADGKTFIAFAHLDGQTLSRKISDGPLTISEVLSIGMQLAEGLQAAHERGVVHRDMKPDNVMLLDGERRLAKILDFGVAQLAGTSKLTKAHTALGTISYMSPEQAEGSTVDRRTDIWSLGVILYEMAGGELPFKGEFDQAVIYSILNEHPKPLTALRDDVPEQLESIVAKCLAKDPASRYQSAADLLVDLRSLSAAPTTSAIHGAASPEGMARASWRLPAAVAAGLALAVAAFWVGRRPPPEAPALNATQVTSDLGVESQPAFSPDGTQIAYVVDQIVAADIYVRLVGLGAPLRLTSHPALDWCPAWSPDGRHIAFIRWGGQATADVMLMPALGGPERKVGEMAAIGWFTIFGGGLEWSPDGRWLVVGSERLPYGLTLLSVETRERRQLTAPQSGLGDLGPTFAPDGRAVAFTRHVSGAITELYVLALDQAYTPQGQPRQLTSQNQLATHPAFTGDGSEIVFSSSPLGSSRLWRIPASGDGGPRPLLGVGANGSYPDISRDGRRLAYAQGTVQINTWRGDFGGDGAASPATRVLSSTGIDFWAQFSPDTERIAFASNRTGHSEIWVANADGASAQQLTSFSGAHSESPRWSPDGRRLAFTSDKDGQYEVYVMDAGGGAAKRLTAGGGDTPTWSGDGQWIYYIGGTDRNLYKAPAEGGDAVLVRKGFCWIGIESPDGKSLYSVTGTAPPTLRRRALPDGPESHIPASLVLMKNVYPANDGVYFTALPPPGEPVKVAFYRLAAGAVETVFDYQKMPSDGLSIAPDGGSVLYSQIDDVQADIVLVDDFR